MDLSHVPMRAATRIGADVADVAVKICELVFMHDRRASKGAGAKAAQPFPPHIFDPFLGSSKAGAGDEAAVMDRNSGKRLDYNMDLVLSNASLPDSQ